MNSLLWGASLMTAGVMSVPLLAILMSRYPNSFLIRGEILPSFLGIVLSSVIMAGFMSTTMTAMEQGENLGEVVALAAASLMIAIVVMVVIVRRIQAHYETKRPTAAVSAPNTVPAVAAIAQPIVDGVVAMVEPVKEAVANAAQPVVETVVAAAQPLIQAAPQPVPANA